MAEWEGDIQHSYCTTSASWAGAFGTLLERRLSSTGSVDTGPGLLGTTGATLTLFDASLQDSSNGTLFDAALFASLSVSRLFVFLVGPAFDASRILAAGLYDVSDGSSRLTHSAFPLSQPVPCLLAIFALQLADT